MGIICLIFGHHPVDIDTIEKNEGICERCGKQICYYGLQDKEEDGINGNEVMEKGI